MRMPVQASPKRPRRSCRTAAAHRHHQCLQSRARSQATASRQCSEVEDCLRNRHQQLAGKAGCVREPSRRVLPRSLHKYQPAKGVWPTSMSWISTPSAHRSADSSWLRPSMTSGAKYSGLPHSVYARPSLRRANRKSTSCTCREVRSRVHACVDSSAEGGAAGEPAPQPWLRCESGASNKGRRALQGDC